MDYAKSFREMTITSEHENAARHIVSEIVANKSKYEEVESITGVPWWWVACVHSLEGSLSFKTHLHNGDSLSRRTIHVPAGRPAVGSPPFTWVDSAVDALRMKKLHLQKDWSLATSLLRWELYNGAGYRSMGVPSPYLWSFSSVYRGGKYVADHVYKANAWSEQCGAAVLLKILVDEHGVTLSDTPDETPEVIVYHVCSPVSESVRAIQNRLNALGYAERQIVVDGLYGVRTRSAVLDFQAENHLATDGKVGPDTWSLMMSEAAKPWPLPASAEGGIDGMRAGAHPDVVDADHSKAAAGAAATVGIAGAVQQSGALDVVQNLTTQADGWMHAVSSIVAAAKFGVEMAVPIACVGIAVWLYMRHRQQIAAITSKWLRDI